MGNMRYCQWRNFAQEVCDACDIQSEADFDVERLSEEEQRAYKRSVEYCRRFFEKSQEAL